MKYDQTVKLLAAPIVDLSKCRRELVGKASPPTAETAIIQPDKWVRYQSTNPVHQCTRAPKHIC